jgi:hypothetical protein
VSPLTQLFYEVSDEALETAASIENGASLLPWQIGPNGPVKIPEVMCAIINRFAMLLGASGYIMAKGLQLLQMKQIDGKVEEEGK